MGLGKTILMATCIFYEFCLQRNTQKIKDSVIMHWYLHQTRQSWNLFGNYDFLIKQRLCHQRYARVLDQNIKFHFLEETGVTLHTIDDSDFNIVISNNQKIIVKKKRKADTPDGCTFWFRFIACRYLWK